ncbi:hypothetical protein MKZ38_006921 [Zalerion maritima]|uniref:Uncharacterized protein n=1 Tax=Zalerion maritima TaxID=339359 RepID=A0AAD5WVN8_9PEZI|nr:hypothetical protein MKZ38_006921 [Zalerion maritima]
MRSGLVASPKGNSIIRQQSQLLGPITIFASPSGAKQSHLRDTAALHPKLSDLGRTVVVRVASRWVPSKCIVGKWPGGSRQEANHPNFPGTMKQFANTSPCLRSLGIECTLVYGRNSHKPEISFSNRMIVKKYLPDTSHSYNTDRHVLAEDLRSAPILDACVRLHNDPEMPIKDFHHLALVLLTSRISYACTKNPDPPPDVYDLLGT